MASSAAYNAGEAMGYERKGQKGKAKLARINAGVAAGYATLGAGLLASETYTRRKYTQNVANAAGRAGPYAYGTGQRPPGAGGAGYRGARRPPRRGYQGDPFKDLGVSSSASAADLKKTWKAKMMQHHPDRGGDPETAKKINAAYQAILKSRGIKDSIYADGFDIDWDSVAL
jgi:DnaJ-domain-containing protein 1